MFNQYEFINDLRQSILNENFDNQNSIEDFIFSYIDNECIYYSDCFDICKILGFTNFTDHPMGDINNICQAAYCALYDLIYNDNSDLLELHTSVTDEL